MKTSLGKLVGLVLASAASMAVADVTPRAGFSWDKIKLAHGDPGSGAHEALRYFR